VGFTSDERNGLLRSFKIRHIDANEVPGGIELVRKVAEFEVATYLDTSHRGGGVSYCHRAVSFKGVRLNVIPISVLSWCGISSATKWQDHSITDSEGILKILEDQTGEFLAFLDAGVKL
jgi:hypothetical protein